MTDLVLIRNCYTHDGRFGDSANLASFGTGAPSAEKFMIAYPNATAEALSHIV